FQQGIPRWTLRGPLLEKKVFVFGGFDNQVDSSSTIAGTGSLSPTPNGIGQLAGCFPGSASVAALSNFGPFAIGAGSPTVAAGTTQRVAYVPFNPDTQTGGH